MAEAGVNDDWHPLVTIALHFSLLSFLAIGGAITALPEMHRQAVEVSHWMTSRQFADLVAIAQAAPGPNVLFVTLIGYFVAGVPGALVATIAMCGPACTVAFFIARTFERFKEMRWRKAIQAGLVPLSVGLVAASALLIARAADRDLATLGITAATFAITYWTRLSPLWALGAATAVGIAGLL
jgi:chromate transporter